MDPHAEINTAYVGTADMRPIRCSCGAEASSVPESYVICMACLNMYAWGQGRWHLTDGELPDRCKVWRLFKHPERRRPLGYDPPARYRLLRDGKEILRGAFWRNLQSRAIVYAGVPYFPFHPTGDGAIEGQAGDHIYRIERLARED